MRSLIGSVIDAVRRPADTRTPVPYGSRWSMPTIFGRNTPGDREAQAAAYGANGTLFAIVGGIATDVSGVEWKLWRKARSGKDEDREPVTSHAAIDVWDNPNPFMARQEYVETCQQHLDLTGEGWILFSRGPSKLADWPVELWPVYPHRMAPVPDPERFVAEYEYRSPDGQVIPLAVRDVALLRQPHPLDMLRGLGVVQAIGIDLDTARAAREWNRNFFLNSALPGGIIEYERGLSDDEWEQQNERWREQHQGVANAHRVATIEFGGKWVDRKYTLADMQFVELLGASGEEIRKAYRYPKAMLGDSNDVNRAVAAAHKAIYAEAIVVPRLNRWKGMLNRKFLPAFGDTAAGLEWDFVSPVPADRDADNAERTSKAAAAKTFIDAGFDGESVKEGLDLPDALVWEGRHAVTKAAPPGQQPGQPGGAGADGQPADGTDAGLPGADPTADPLAEARARLLGDPQPDPQPEPVPA
jgi:HK97 family phage portal protein